MTVREPRKGGGAEAWAVELAIKYGRRTSRTSS